MNCFAPFGIATQEIFITPGPGQLARYATRTPEAFPSGYTGTVSPCPIQFWNFTTQFGADLPANVAGAGIEWILQNPPASEPITFATQFTLNVPLVTGYVPPGDVVPHSFGRTTLPLPAGQPFEYRCLQGFFAPTSGTARFTQLQCFRSGPMQ